MIALDHIIVRSENGDMGRNILSDVNVTFSPQAGMIGILGARKSGKTTLINLLAGTTKPDSGFITRTGSVSWLMSSMRPLVQNMTVRANIRFIGMLYGVDISILRHEVSMFAGLHDVMDTRLNELPRDIQAHLVYCLCLCLRFDYYLADESFLIGDDSFRKNMTDYLIETFNDRTVILASRSPSLIKKHCQTAYVLHDGQLHYFEQPSEAVHAFKILDKH